MRIYNMNGVPSYSDELYHHGIKGQKWYVRRFQYEDGTLTPLGKLRYSIGETTKKISKTVTDAVASAGKTVAKHEVDNFKRRHTWVMSDDELKKMMARLELEKKYKQAAIDLRKMNRSKIGAVLGDYGKRTADKMFNRASDELVNNLFKKKDSITDYESILKNPSKYTDKEISDAFKRITALKGTQKASEEFKSSKPSEDKTFKDAGKVFTDGDTRKAKESWSRAFKSRSVIFDSPYESSKSSAETTVGKAWVSDFIYDSYDDYKESKKGHIT